MRMMMLIAGTPVGEYALNGVTRGQCRYFTITATVNATAGGCGYW